LFAFEDSDFIKKLPCNHEFHKKCIRTWIMNYKKRVCPMCKQNPFIRCSV
jgi:hypothetical protein